MASGLRSNQGALQQRALASDMRAIRKRIGPGGTPEYLIKLDESELATGLSRGEEWAELAWCTKEQAGATALMIYAPESTGPDDGAEIPYQFALDIIELDGVP